MLGYSHAGDRALSLTDCCSQVPLSVRLLDFSPEWDFTTGGSKVLFCIRPGIDVLFKQEVPAEFENMFECSFGECVVPLKFI
jgi:hypothetical protein